jgi:hypothetical protein
MELGSPAMAIVGATNPEPQTSYGSAEIRFTSLSSCLARPHGYSACLVRCLAGVVLRAAIVESGSCAFQHVNKVFVDLRRFDGPHGVVDAAAVCPVHKGLDDPLGVAYDGNIRAVRDHDNLASWRGIRAQGGGLRVLCACS